MITKTKTKTKVLLLLPLLLLALVTMALPSVVFADDDGTETEDETEEETETETETQTEDEDDTETEANTDDDESNDDTETETESQTIEALADNPGNGDTQPDRVGSHDNDQQTSPEGSNGGGTVTDPTITGDPDVVDEGDTVTTNCFGKVISHEAQEHKTDPDEGTLGEHSSDPVPEIPGNETPRQGIGNQNQGHPAAHGAFNSQFEEEDAENVEENC